MDKVSYSLGVSVANNMLNSGVNSLTLPDFTAGLTDLLNDKKLQMTQDEINKTLKEYFDKIKKEMEENAKKDGVEFLAENAKHDGVVTLPSGLQYKVLFEGNGKKPNKNSTVKCHYEGKLITGEVFDSSYQRNKPASFGLSQVIPGWTEGLQLMSEGSKYELYIPYNLAYGERGVPNAIPPYSTLIFTVELLKVS